MRGKRIRTLEDLWIARENRRSVYIPSRLGLWGPKPAAFVLNFSGEIILRGIREGLRIYEPAPSPFPRGVKNSLAAELAKYKK